jgi:hypothetical protein
MTIVVGNYKFKNKTAADTYMKTLLKKYENGRAFNAHDLAFVRDALQYRKDFGDGVNLLDIEITDVFVRRIGSTYHLHIKRSDGSTVEVNHNKIFSRRKTTGKFNNTNQMNRFLRACRYEIKDYIERIPGNTKDVDIHHTNVRFRNMVDDFIKQYNIDVEAVKVSGLVDNRRHTAFVDRNLAKRWVQFHNDNSDIVLVSPKLHAKLHRKRR